MPIGNVSRDSGPKKDNRPPWVKEKDAAAPPSWTQTKLKPVENSKTTVAKTTGETEQPPVVKTFKPGLKKQATIREKPENGVSETVEEKLVKPSAAKLADKARASEEKSKFTKSALKSIDKIPKLEDKLSIREKSKEKSPEKPILKSVRTIDDKTKEKSVTIVDRKPIDKNGTTRTNTTAVNDKIPNKTTTSIHNKSPSVNDKISNEKLAANRITSGNDKAINEKSVPNKITTNEKSGANKTVTIIDKSPNEKNKSKPISVNDKFANNKSTPNKSATENDKALNEKSTPNTSTNVSNKTSSENSASNKTTTVSDKSTKENTPITKTTTINSKDSNEKSVVNSINKESKPVTKPVAETTVKPKVEDKETDKSTMATKPPLEKGSSKLPPRKPPLAKQPSKDDGPVKKWRDPLHERVKENIDKTLANDIPKGHTLTKNESLRSLLKPTPPPMPPPLPPKMPPPPEFKKAPLDPTKLKKLESLRSRPRRRPDWSDMMKEVEEGRKLKKVVCNDRSSPIITKSTVVKNKDQFIFESEKPNSHNELLKEINKGIKLKKVKCNDRSKPILEGLRKFRRQMTIEEQVQKSMSQANLAASPSSTVIPGSPISEGVPGAPEEDEIDEMDDIDKVRDDLQSTKQLLAIELRNKEAQERENKRLQTRIANLEAELARERAIIKQEQQKTVISVTDAYDERLVNSLKQEVEKTKENADNLEKRYLEAAEERDSALTELEELKRLNSDLQKQLHQALLSKLEDIYESEEPLSFYQKRQLEFEKQCRLLNIDVNSAEAHSLRKSIANNNIAFSAASTNIRDEGIMPSSRRSSHAIKQLSITKDDSFEEESDSEPEEEESEEKKQKRMEKEVRNMRNKIRHLKEKQDHMKKERMGFKMALKNQQAALKEEKKKYKELKREVDKMAAMMKEVGTDDDEEEEEEESEDEKKSSEEEETETETEQDTESETESESEPEDAPLPNKKENLTKRVKRHETRVNALKKGNTLLMANVDRMKDDVLKQREESIALQKELDSLIDDLE